MDVALLDMNHGWPNLGHDSLVHVLREAVCDLIPDLEAAGLSLRVLSFDVRRGRLPEPPGPRFALYVGTGGPGNLDPRNNDGVSDGSQGILEDASWEPRAFALYDMLYNAAFVGAAALAAVTLPNDGYSRPLFVAVAAAYVAGAVVYRVATVRTPSAVPVAPVLEIAG